VAFGHSFGGLLAILWALARPPALTRLIVQSPFLGFGFRVPPWKAMAATMLATCWPAFRFPMGLDASALSHDPAVVQAYRTDPLVHQFITARTYRSLVASMRQVQEGAGALRVPVLLLYGADDRIVSLQAAQQWFDRLPGEKSCVVFPGCFHELHHEPVREAVIERIRAWVLESESG
jgi:alpha-beta hydrolase superfamily lysophospholipase